MGQLNHPYSSMVKASQSRRLKALGATSGKAWGNAASQQTSHYPKTHAGVEAPMTVSGKSAPKRADRYARGGRVKGRGSTTNIIIAHPGGGAGGNRPTPVPVPVPSGMPAVGVPPRPAMPMAAPAPVAAAPAGMPLPAGVRPPGMKAGGAVKKLANGGFLKESPGNTYRGFPHSPTISVDDAVSAHKKGGAVKKVAKWARGGKVVGEPDEGFKKPNQSDVFHAGFDEYDNPRNEAVSDVIEEEMKPDVEEANKKVKGRYRKGGAVMKAGAGSGKGRLQKIGAARAVPARTEL